MGVHLCPGFRAGALACCGIFGHQPVGCLCMGLVESVVGEDELGPDESDDDDDDEAGLEPIGSGAMSSGLPYPQKGLRVLSVEEGSPAARSRLLAWVQPPLGGGSSISGPFDGLISFADVILSANGVECVRPVA